MAAVEKDRILKYRGEQLLGADGDKLGAIEEIYLDPDTREPQWALVHTGLFGTKRTFVPLHEATENDGGLTVPLEKSMVKEAPGIDPNGRLSQDEEAELYRHYGMQYPESQSDGGVGEGPGDRDAGEDEAGADPQVEELPASEEVPPEESDVDDASGSAR